ncbi:MAG: hypothetical protein JWL64_1716 [Frankiales bacterium]|nr:hypothetical protein [Frankiales bacterium]
MVALHPDMERLGWLVGRWHGTGAMVWPGAPDATYVADIEIEHDGRPFLAYRSRTWIVDAAGVRGAAGPVESGWWRRGAGIHDVELVLADPTGVVEVLVGTVAFKKIQLISDLVARTETATSDRTASSRLYGGVDGDLAYVLERAAGGQPLQPYLSARLSPVTAD